MFVFCWVQTMFLFMDKRFEKAGKEVVWSCLWQCFHQGTGLLQCACACAYNVLSSGHSLVAMMLYLYLWNLQYAFGNVLHQSQACGSVLVLVIVICDVLVAMCFHQGTGWPRERWLWNFAQTDDYSLQTHIHYKDWFVENFNSRRNLPLARKCLWICSIGALVWWGD